MMALWWVLIALGVFFLAKWLLQQREDRQAGDSPLEILDKRYAKGEISEQEYERLKKTLTQ